MNEKPSYGEKISLQPDEADGSMFIAPDGHSLTDTEFDRFMRLQDQQSNRRVGIVALTLVALAVFAVLTPLVIGLFRWALM